MRALLILISALTAAQDLHYLDRLRDTVEALQRRSSGVLGFVAVDLQTGHRVAFQQDLLFAQASLIKVPILFRLFEAHAAELTQPVTVQPHQAVDGGPLALTLKSGPVTRSVRQLAELMIQESDNTATNILIARLGMPAINTSMARLGLTQTRLQRIMLDAAAARRNEENVSTPADIANLFLRLYRDPALAELVEILKPTRADIRAAVPESIPVASKPGEVPGVHTEAAIVYLPGRPYLLVVMASFLDDNENPIPALARATHATFTRLAASNRFGNRLP